MASYLRRLCRRLVRHHRILALQGPNNSLSPSIVELAVADANRATSVSPLRRRGIIGTLRDAKIGQVASEGAMFLETCRGGICFAQGDVLPKEAIGLVKDVQRIFAGSIAVSERVAPAVPELSEILYKPFWKPRSSSICQIPGVPLISNSCGRIQR